MSASSQSAKQGRQTFSDVAPRLQSIKRKGLGERFKQLETDYSTAISQITATNDDVEKNRLQRKADALYQELEKVEAELKALDLAPTENPTPVDFPIVNFLGGNAPPGPQPFLGRQNDLERIQKSLGLYGGKAQQRIGIYGLPGVGKSTFLAHFARDERVRRGFPEGILFAGLGQKSAAERLMLSEWCRLADVPTAGLSDREMAVRLGERLFGKRILLVVDDVWKEYDLGLVPYLLHPTVSLVFTSRIPAVAHGLSPKSNYKLSVLDGDSAFSILQYFAPATANEYEGKCRELADSLGRLPLALNVAGRLISARERLGLGVGKLFEYLLDGSKLLEEQVPPSMRLFIEQ
ncbi:MAG: NB-ARC domain-containing protein, partial [Candidatus Methylumidiphilus sp.]